MRGGSLMVAVVIKQASGGGAHLIRVPTNVRLVSSSVWATVHSKYMKTLVATYVNTLFYIQV